MRRRDFLLGIGALALSPRSHAAAPRVNGARLNRRLSDLSRFGRTAEGGISRVAYSDADLNGRDFAMKWMREAGLDVRTDTAGNLLGRRAGTEPDLPPILLGSHIDSVPEGGNYDGQVGSMGAIEVAHTLEEAGVRTRHPLEVVIFQNEENGKTGSRAMVGEVTEKDLALPSHTDKTVGEGIAFIGGDPERLDEARRRPGDIAAFFELHIEQGGVLEERGIDVGVVEGIVGIERWVVVIEGFANHAGTTPMDQRRDALLTAGRFIDLVNQVVTSTPGRQVATVGRIEAHPGAPNVIPGRVELSLEIRDLAMDHIERFFARIEREARGVASRNRTSISFERYYVSRAAPTDERLRELVRKAAHDLGLSTLSMPSGAGHDAQSIALVAPVGMIFIPSTGGISHSPKEYSRPEDIEAGANVLLGAVLGADILALA
ncbi:MAG TPA: Zn-dependent hydrolase [Vicinamibacteria bacterium]|nr:Zn-dependent hydrolase [Vicinamibacteria bacterium]